MKEIQFRTEGNRYRMETNPFRSLENGRSQLLIRKMCKELKTK
ncbi:MULTISPECIES: hypothetical protein [Marinifilum]|nr:MULTISPECIES: hypothetical protein [Marinifilum]